MKFLMDEDMTAPDDGVASMERGIRHQEKIVAELRRLGEPTQLAEKFLLRLRHTLEAHRRHRDVVARRNKKFVTSSEAPTPGPADVPSDAERAQIARHP